MADNITAPATGALLATDECAINGVTVQVPRVKVTWGVDGSAVDASATNPLPVGGAAIDAITAKLELVRLLLVTIGGYEDGVEGFLDGVEGLIGATNTALTTQNGYLDQVEGKLDTLGGYLDQVEAKLDNMITALTDANPSVVTSLTKRSLAASFTRPADTTAYSVGDLIANNTAFGSVVPLEFVNCARVNAGTGTITAASVRAHTVRAGSDLVRLHIFRDIPVVTVNGDNGPIGTAIAGRTAIHLGSFDLTLDNVFNDGTMGASAPRNRGSIVFECGAGKTSLYGLLEARSAVSGVSAEPWSASLEIVQD